MNKIQVHLDQKSYSIYIATGLLQSMPEYVRQIPVSRTCVIITDTNVDPLYAQPAANLLSQHGFQVFTYVIPAGEPYKSQATVSQVYDWLLTENIARDATIIAIGGGVVGDLAGFVAATYLRGVRFIQIPTTLLAQVDSSVGGKVGINHRLGKNVIGAFYQPALVLIDPMVLTTLPRRELYSGYAEVLKYALILDASMFVKLQQNPLKLLSLSDWDWLAEIIGTCCSLKRDIVQHDEREHGLRRILNFGHTIGHALEAITEYAYFKHGEAIAWGMIAAAHISFLKNYISHEDFRAITQLLSCLEKPPIPRSLTVQQVLDAMSTDKKIDEHGLNFITLKKIGKAKIEIVEQHILRAAINFVVHEGL